MSWLPVWLRQRLHTVSRRAFGDRGERAAARFLRRRGMKILERQHRSRLGEIDLVAVDCGQVVFVEVKTRTSDVAGRPDEAVTHAKQKKLTRLALGYLKSRGWLGTRSARFDVVAVTWPKNQKKPDIVHYKNAFDAIGVDGFFS